MEHQNLLVTKKMRSKRKSHAEGDYSKRISPRRLSFDSLHEDIVLRIMSKLTLKQAVRMSVVSRKLRRAWMLHPNLSFDISSVLGSKAESNQSSDQYKRMLGTKRFIDRVSNVLKKHSGLAVNNLAIKFELRKEHAQHIDGWILFVIASKAKVVSLNFSPYLVSCENNYRFPDHLFNSQNGSYLQVLNLDSVNLGPGPDFGGFANLKSVALNHVLVQDLERFLSKCPGLECLSFRMCDQLHDLQCSQPLCQLKYLCVQDCLVDKIEFVVPKLMKFEYRGSKTLIKLHECLNLKTAEITFSVENTLEYVFTCLPNVLPHVETLHMQASAKSQMPVFKHPLLKFTHLKHMTLKVELPGDIAVLQLANLLEIAPLLKNLHLDMFCSDHSIFRKNGDIIGYMIADRTHYYLKTAEIIGFCGNRGQAELAKYIMRNAVHLERMTVEPTGRTRNLGYYSLAIAKIKLVPLDMHGVLTIREKDTGPKRRRFNRAR